MNKLLDFLFKLLLRRELRKMDQWLRWKIVDGKHTYFVEFSMRDDGHDYTEVKL